VDEDVDAEMIGPLALVLRLTRYLSLRSWGTETELELSGFDSLLEAATVVVSSEADAELAALVLMETDDEEDSVEAAVAVVVAPTEVVTGTDTDELDGWRECVSEPEVLEMTARHV
jgi:hypothetical protein